MRALLQKSISSVLGQPEPVLTPAEILRNQLLATIDQGFTPDTKTFLHDTNRAPHNADPLLNGNTWSRYVNNALYRMVLGAAAFGYGKPEIATMHFRHAENLTDNALVAHCLARSYSAVGNEVAALEILEAGMNAFPENVDLRVEACTALFRMGETAAANALFKPVVAAFTAQQQDCTALAEELRLAIEGNLSERDSSGDLYDDKFVTDLWWDYSACFTRFNEYQEGSAFMSYLIRKEVGKAVRDSDATAVVDFGVMCGAPNYGMAEEFSHIRHFGVDRQGLIKELNDAYYSRENMVFEAGDIFDFLGNNKNSLRGATLFHARTAAVCYPAVVRDLYKACHAYGIDRIVAIEFGGLSKETLEFTDFRHNRSVAMRSNMFIHPYETMLEAAGFQIESSTRRSKYALFMDIGSGESTISTIARRV